MCACVFVWGEGRGAHNVYLRGWSICVAVSHRFLLLHLKVLDHTDDGITLSTNYYSCDAAFADSSIAVAVMQVRSVAPGAAFATIVE